MDLPMDRIGSVLHKEKRFLSYETKEEGVDNLVETKGSDQLDFCSIGTEEIHGRS